MPARLPGLRWAPHVAMFGLLLPLLSDCGPTRNQFPPPCPGSTILGDAADYNLYRPTSAPGGAHDLTDLVVQGRIVGIQGTCKEGDKNQLAVTATLSVELTRGPAMQGRQIDVPLFIAVVTEGDVIVDKRVYAMRAIFPSNIDRITLSPGEADLTLPVSTSKTGADYTIVAGFQLTPGQLSQSLQNQRP
jgi:hypothetical protein